MTIRSKLQQKAAIFLKTLSKNGLEAELEQQIEYGDRYQLRDQGAARGFFTIWYSPKKDSYKLTVNELSSSLKKKIQTCWQEGGQKAFSAQTPLKGLHMFVDGSHRKGVITWAWVAVRDENIVSKKAGHFIEKEYMAQANVAGEIQAVLEALSWVAAQGDTSVSVHYDYTGLRHWALGEWKARNPLTQRYAGYFKALNLKIEWVKVKGHSGHLYNEMADAMAGELSGQ